MHVPEVQLHARTESFQLPELVPFVRPPFYALLFGRPWHAPFGVAFWALARVQTACGSSGIWAWAFPALGIRCFDFRSISSHERW